MIKLIGMIIMLFPAIAFAGTEHPSEPYVGSAPFEKLKQLEGKWEGTVVEGGQTESKPAEVIYEVSSGESAVVEKLFAGTEHEMVSVYNDEKGSLVMTHYCMLKNQPKLKLVNATDNKIEMEFTEGNGVAITDPHMHALKITFDGPDKMTQEWFGYENGKRTETATTLQLKKV